MKRSRRKPLTEEEREQAGEFHEVAQRADKCAACGRPPTPGLGPLESHHVVAAAELRSRHLDVYDPRNAFPIHRGCHAAHEGASHRIPERKLMAKNIDYAYEVLGPFAADYIRARYPMQEQTEETG